MNNKPVKGIMRVGNHPKFDEILVLRFGPELNQIIGSFAPARQALDMGGYIISRDHFAALQSWAGYNSVTLVPEFRQAGEGEHRAYECDNVIEHFWDGERRVEIKCSTPYPNGRTPKFCSECGQPGKPVPVIEKAPVIETTLCPNPNCGHRQPGRSRYCSHCGSVMEYGEPHPMKAVLRALQDEGPRERLDAPVPISRVMPSPKPPFMPQTKQGRPIENIELPEPEALHETPGDATYPEPSERETIDVELPEAETEDDDDAPKW